MVFATSAQLGEAPQQPARSTRAAAQKPAAPNTVAGKPAPPFHRLLTSITRQNYYILSFFSPSKVSTGLTKP